MNISNETFRSVQGDGDTSRILKVKIEDRLKARPSSWKDIEAS